MITTTPIVRRSARLVLLDDDGCLVMIKRTKPGQEPYWTTPGGGEEPGDPSREAAAAREAKEELGAQVMVGQQVFLVSSESDQGIAVQHYFLARLLGLDPVLRTGLEHTDPSRGTYETVRIPLANVAGIDVRPHQLRDFIAANSAALLADLPTA